MKLTDRLVRGPYGSLEAFLDQFGMQRREDGTLLVGVDGYRGSGKSSLVREMARREPDTLIIHMDGFFQPTGQRPLDIPDGSYGVDYDWQRLRDQVLRPLSEGREAAYQLWNWEERRLGPFRTIPVGQTVIVEGLYTLRRELIGFYDLTVWMDCPEKTRLKRLLERNGAEFQAVWEKDWAPAEALYTNLDDPREGADLVIASRGD